MEGRRGKIKKKGGEQKWKRAEGKRIESMGRGKWDGKSRRNREDKKGE